MWKSEAMTLDLQYISNRMYLHYALEQIYFLVSFMVTHRK
jgi:hypothetical protein